MLAHQPRVVPIVLVPVPEDVKRHTTESDSQTFGSDMFVNPFGRRRYGQYLVLSRIIIPDSAVGSVIVWVEEMMKVEA